MLRFWLDRGVDGFRIDVAHALEQGPRDFPTSGRGPRTSCVPHGGADHPFWDQRRGARGLPRLAQRRRRATPATGCSSARPGSTDARAAGPLHSGRTSCSTAFNFDFLRAPWDADALRGRDRRVPRRGRRPSAHRPPGCCPTTTSPATPPATRGSTDRRRRGQGDRVGRTPARPRARPAPGPGRGAAHARAARLGVRLPGRGARPARRPRPAGGGAAGPDLGALRPHRARPRRLPGADPVVRRRTVLRLRDRRALAAAAAVFADVSVQAESGCHRVDARALPARRSAAASASWSSGRPSTGCRHPRARCPSAGRHGRDGDSSASSPAPPTKSRCPAYDEVLVSSTARWPPGRDGPPCCPATRRSGCECSEGRPETGGSTDADQVRPSEGPAGARCR